MGLDYDKLFFRNHILIRDYLIKYGKVLMMYYYYIVYCNVL